jgi:acyl dehydratase
MIGLFYEEIAPGLAVELGTYHFTREAILSFAKAYDPQPFHVDEAAARTGPFGVLIASGWHTAAAWMKCYMAANDAHRNTRVAEGEPVPEQGPSPGFAHLKWLKPVRPGDTISYRLTVTGKRVLSSRPRWGLVESLNEGVNQTGQLVFSFEGRVLVQRMVAAPDAGG